MTAWRPTLALKCLWLLLLLLAMPAFAGDSVVPSSALPWWFWPLALFVTCFLIGIVAVPAGIGGGTLFVPIIGGFFPFHLDFVRGAGLLVALASALAAGPVLLRGGLSSLRLALPLALVASMSSIAGAMLGLALPASVIQTALGLIVLGIVTLMLVSKKSEFPQVAQPDRLSSALGIHGVFIDGASGRAIDWQVHRTPLGLVLFLAIGVMAGMFGIGAGWANVPALNLLMGAPLESVRGHLRAGAVAGGFVSRMGVPEPRRRAADDRCALGGWHDAGRPHRRTLAAYPQRICDPQDGDHAALVCRHSRPAQGSGAMGLKVNDQ